MPPRPPREIIDDAKNTAAAAEDQIALAKKLAALAAAAAKAQQYAEAARHNAREAEGAAAATAVAAAEDRLSDAKGLLREAVALTAPAALQAGVGDPKDQWKECRTTIDRFDKLLVDLRKTGFGFVTALVAAATFIFNQTTPAIKAALFCILVVLIVTLYLIDRVHQVWLLETVRVAKKLEVQLNYELTTDISNQFSGRDATLLGFWLYVILLFATGAIFWEAMPQDEAVTGGHRTIVYGAVGVGLVFMIVPLWEPIWEFLKRHRGKVVVAVLIVAGLILFGYLNWYQ